QPRARRRRRRRPAAAAHASPDRLSPRACARGRCGVFRSVQWREQWSGQPRRELTIPRYRRPHSLGAHVRGLSDVAHTPPDEHEVRNVLSFRSFRRLWIALSLSSLGDWLGFVATTRLATELERGYRLELY